MGWEERGNGGVKKREREHGSIAWNPFHLCCVVLPRHTQVHFCALFGNPFFFWVPAIYLFILECYKWATWIIHSVCKRTLFAEMNGWLAEPLCGRAGCTKVLIPIIAAFGEWVIVLMQLWLTSQSSKLYSCSCLFPAMERMQLNNTHRHAMLCVFLVHAHMQRSTGERTCDLNHLY